MTNIEKNIFTANNHRIVTAVGGASGTTLALYKKFYYSLATRFII